MLPLEQELQKNKNTLLDFYQLTKRILIHLENVISGFDTKNNYRIYYAESAGTIKYTRPVNINLFINDQNKLEQTYSMFLNCIDKIRNKTPIFGKEKLLIDQTLYTIQQSIGVGLDLLVNPNSARKHVGNRFEELITAFFTETGISNTKIILKIPYETEEGIKTYKCENDLILSPFEQVKSTSSYLNEKEVVLSIKTTSKDRMGKIFIDKLLLENFIGHKQKVIGIFLNDVQRKERNNISFTLVSGLFMVYSKFLTELDGIYYLDPPPTTTKQPYSKFMKPFSELINTDLWKILTP